MTIDGATLTGSTSLNKAGKGTLTFEGKHTYTGATTVQEGVFEFKTLLNGGEPSALGASEDFAQNWVFAGGKYRYSGSKPSP